MNVEPQDLIDMVKLQRTVQADEAAMMAAACEGLKRRVAELEKQLAALEKSPRQKAKGGRNA